MKEKFKYDIEPGAIMDYVDDRFMLVIKDEEWTQEEIELLNEGIQLHFCYTQEIVIFVLEGGDIDSSDFYFNIQECDFKDQILEQDLYTIEIILVDGNNDICFKKDKTLSIDDTKILKDHLTRQNMIEFMPGEFDVNVEGIQMAYEPFELIKFEKCLITL